MDRFAFPLSTLVTHTGRAPFNNLVEGMRSAQKTDFERLVSSKEGEVSLSVSLSVSL
jgi:hypothetical protein